MSTPGSRAGPGAVAPCQPSSSSVESSGCTEPDPGLLLPVTQSRSVLARHLLNARAYSSSVTRRKREMIPNERKDSNYWVKRNKNNEAARRSREKKRLSDLMVDGQLLALSEENTQLRAKLLSMQYHSSLGAERRKSASETSNVPSSPAVFQPGLWGNNGSNAFSLEAKIPRFSSTGVGGFNPHSSLFSQGFSPLSGPRVLSPEAEMEAQRQVSSSDDIHKSTDASALRAFLPPPDHLHHASTRSPRSWLLPHMNPSAVCNNFLLPWRSSYLPPPGVYPGLPLYIQERQGQGLGVEADTQLGGFKSRFSRRDAPQS
ncbi:hypothetical protein CgunFtcFv8_027216 [Champsocephalus gunnari]|uniref:BZIP domain-containing protein n=1 Tax=Champsocephalus gunnari TaxID=52237 RepID=A0AAN8DZE6_CHAGU|nr:hypothetical protein CgunFtcFv8_027216 [Champsocephalus gunnari]